MSEKVGTAMRTPLVQRSARRFLFLAVVLALLIVTWLAVGRHAGPEARFSLDRIFGKTAPAQGNRQSYRMPPKPSDNYRYSTTVVTGVLSNNRTEADWIHDLDHVERKAIYIVDDLEAELHLERNHGREAAVYLKYIVDHYYNLTDITFFMHAHPFAWHNNILMRQHSGSTLNLLRRSYVQKQGYVNTRCDLHPGCPRWVTVDPTPGESKAHAVRALNIYNSEAWKNVYPESEEVPRYLAAPCCAQFGVSKETIQAIPLTTFKRMSKWIAEDPLDGFTGRFMEYSWHYLFAGKAELCPSMTTCYCEMYGMCDLDGDLLHKWQSHYNRATELEDQSFAIQNAYDDAGKAQGFQTDQEYLGIRETVQKMWTLTTEFADEITARYAIPTIQGLDPGKGASWIG